jgi:hypothetical protein
MSEPKKKPGVAFWSAVVVALLVVGYPLSFGPACWISSRAQPSGRIVSAAYRPILRLWIDGPDWVKIVLANYVDIGARSSSNLSVDFWVTDPPEINFLGPRK